MQETRGTWVRSLGWEEPLEKEMAATAVFLPGKLCGQRSLAGYSPCTHKESDTTEQMSTHALNIYCHISIVLLCSINKEGKSIILLFQFRSVQRKMLVFTRTKDEYQL